MSMLEENRLSDSSLQESLIPLGLELVLLMIHYLLNEEEESVQ